MPIYKFHAAVEINSSHIDYANKSSFTFHLPRDITFQSHKQYTVRPEDVLLPHSFYQIRETNNTFIVIETDGSGLNPVNNSISVPVGTYQISDLIILIDTLLEDNTTYGNTYIFAYEDETGHVSISLTGGTSSDFSIASTAAGSTLNKSLGFSIEGVVGGTPIINIVGTYHAVLKSIPSVNLHMRHMTSHNYYDRHGHKSVGARIPITVGRSQTEYFPNHDGLMMMLDGNHPISRILPQLTIPGLTVNAPDEILELNGGDFSFLLVFYEYNK